MEIVSTNTDKTDVQNLIEAPTAVKVFPFIVAATYFSYSYYYKKNELFSSATISAMIFVIASFPWFSWRKQALASTSPVGMLSVASDLNKMNKNGRQIAIDYLSKYDKSPMPYDIKVAAYKTLTNDELKVLYCMYKFQEDKEQLLSRFGTAVGDAQAKKVAMEVYGIDLSGIDIAKATLIATGKVNLYSNKR